VSARRRLPLLALVACAACGGGGDAASAARPNVLLLVMDTTRADRCGFDGYARPTTPRLDAFAKDAVVFKDAWAPAGWTAPSHASLFTGLRPEHHGVMDGMRPFLADGAATLAKAFLDGGWRTGCFSNNDYVSEDYGLAQGFETVVPLWKENNERRRAYPWAPDTHERALDWARACAAEKKRFFLFVNDMEPHLPYTPPAAFAKRFLPSDAADGEVSEAEAFQFPASVGFVLGEVPAKPRKLALMSDLYDAEIATLDDAVGRLLDGLKAADLLKNTVVVVCADHGENLGEHGFLGHFQSLHRTTLHVPLIVRFPGKFDGGRAVADVVRLEDVPPTLLELCGLPPMKDVDGASLLHGLAGRAALAVQGEQSATVPKMKDAFPDAPASAFETLKKSIRSVYDGRFHLIRDSAGKEELYDVAADPGETKDLAPADVDDLHKMRKMLDAR
jgi:arylsulfatase A-like enzyme